MAGRYAISNVHLESGVSLAKGSVCARMELIVTHSMVNVYALVAGPVAIVTKSVLLIGMDRIAVKRVAVDTVGAVIIFLGNVIVLLVILVLFVMICVHLENTATSANRNVNAKITVPAIPLLVNAIVLLVGQV